MELDVLVNPVPLILFKPTENRFLDFCDYHFIVSIQMFCCNILDIVRIVWSADDKCCRNIFAPCT